MYVVTAIWIGKTQLVPVIACLAALTQRKRPAGFRPERGALVG
jgi:hypothetical protein